MIYPQWLFIATPASFVDTMERYTDSITWYVVFDKCYARRWWSYFLHKDFGHVHLWRQAQNQSIMINLLSHAMCVRHCDQTIEQAIENELAHGCTAILSHTVHYSAFYKPRPLEPITCVSVAKRLLCISKPITPKQLYHEMIEAGATIIKPFTIL